MRIEVKDKDVPVLLNALREAIDTYDDAIELAYSNNENEDERTVLEQRRDRTQALVNEIDSKFTRRQQRRRAKEVRLALERISDALTDVADEVGGEMKLSYPAYRSWVTLYDFRDDWEDYDGTSIIEDEQARHHLELLNTETEVAETEAMKRLIEAVETYLSL